MTTCLILNDTTVTNLLTTQTKPDILTFLTKISQSLISFSGPIERTHQPEPVTLNRPEGQRDLFRIFTSPTGVGVKIIVHPSPADIADPNLSDAERKRLDGLHGTLVLCDQHGFPSAFINAAEITGYRTTLSAMILYVKRECTSRVVLFGAGKQALWHLRIMLGLRGEEIEKVTVVNRNVSRAEEVIGQIKAENAEKWKVSTVFEVVGADDSGKLEGPLREADVVFCTTGSKKVLFPAEWVEGSGKGGKGRYISAIGSWQADMIELEPELIKRAAAGQEKGDGMVVVDNGVDCVENTGEIVGSGLGMESVTEVGMVLQELEGEGGLEELRRCVKSGFLVYKSVGVGLTDLAAGQALVELAKEKGKGIAVDDF